MVEAKTLNQRFQILSLSGGGYRGLYTATVLARLEKEAKKPIGQCFDLIAGTSIGGILALGIALEIPVAEMLEAFEKNGTSIFSDRTAPRFWISKLTDLARSLVGSKYSSTELRATVSKLLGENTKLREAKHPVIIPAVNISTGRPKIFKTPHHDDLTTDLHCSVLEIALATSAAPTIFPVSRVGKSHFADGGLFANSPDMIALHEARYYLGVDDEAAHVLSIGTTEVVPGFVPGWGNNLGLLGWGYNQRLLSMSFACQEQCVHHMMKHCLKEKFVRINDIQSKEHQSHVGLDIASSKARDILFALGEESATRAMGTSNVRQMLEYQSSFSGFSSTNQTSLKVGNDGHS